MIFYKIVQYEIFIFTNLSGLKYMITARQLNSDNNPVYGAYIMGRYWHFTVLHGVYYSVHTGLNAADDGIKQIFGVLKKTKQFIDNMI